MEGGERHPQGPMDVQQCQLGFKFQNILLCMQTCQLTCSQEVLRSSSLITLLFIPASGSMEGCSTLTQQQLLALKPCL